MGLFKKALSVFLRIGISIILLIFLFLQMDKQSLIDIIKDVHMDLLLFAFFIFLFNYILCIFRWEMLLKAIKIHLPFKRIIVSFAAGLFFSLFLPSSIGGDFMRSIDLATHTKKPREVVATVLLDRLSGFVGLVGVCLLSVFFGWRLIQDTSVIIFVAAITLILVVILLVLFNRFLYSKINRILHSSSNAHTESRRFLQGLSKLRESIKNLHQEMHIFRHHKKTIFYNLMLSFLVQVVYPLSIYLVALSLGIKINIIYFFVFLPIISAITMLPISIGGLGLRDATSVFFFAKAGVSKNLSFGMSLLTFLFTLLCGSIGGLIYVLTLHHRRLQHHKSPSLHTAHH